MFIWFFKSLFVQWIQCLEIRWGGQKERSWWRWWLVSNLLWFSICPWCHRCDLAIHSNGWKNTKLPKNCKHKYNIFRNVFMVMYGHHILNYFCLFSICVISFIPTLINYFEKSNKHWKNWTYGIYISKLGLWTEFLGEFCMVYDTNIHQLNLGKFKI
jgi:hypothetical protein